MPRSNPTHRTEQPQHDRLLCGLDDSEGNWICPACRAIQQAKRREEFQRLTAADAHNLDRLQALRDLIVYRGHTRQHESRRLLTEIATALTEASA